MSTTKWVHGTGQDQAKQRLGNLSDIDRTDALKMAVRQAGRKLEEGKVGEAEAILRQGLERDPDHADCRAYLAICLAARQRKYVTAEKIARNVLQKSPYEPTAHYALGRINLLGGRRAVAFKHFARARALAEGDRAWEQRVDRMDPRQPPVLRFLPRDNALNILLGRLRSSLGGKD